MKRHIVLAITIFIGCLQVDSQNQKLNPKELFVLMVDAVEKNPTAKRIDITKPFLKRIDSSNLSREDQFYLGEIYFWNFMPKPANAMYKLVSEGNDDLARSAMKRELIIQTRAFKNIEKAEKLLNSYRLKFPPKEQDYNYLYGRVYEVADSYAKKGNHKKSIDLVEEELKALDYKSPYNSYKLLIHFFTSYKELGKEKVAIQQLENIITELKKELTQRIDKKPQKDEDFVVHIPKITNMLTLVDKKLNYSQITEKFKDLIAVLEKSRVQLQNF